MKVLLIGDNAVDVFINVDCQRLSPERPIPVVIPHSARENPGMAGNVLANILSLAPDIDVTPLFPAQPSVKTRYVDRGSNQHFLRVDQDVISEPLGKGTFIDTLCYMDDGSGLPIEWDAVVVSDYAKGFLNTDNMHLIALWCRDRDIPVFMDTKAILGEWSQSVTVVKINAKEYAAQLAAGVKAPWLECKNLIVTQGAKGMVLFDEEGGEEYRALPDNINVVDTVGCGDVALAGLVVGYLETGDLVKAIDFATKASSIASSKRGVVTVSRLEVTRSEG